MSILFTWPINFVSNVYDTYTTAFQYPVVPTSDISGKRVISAMTLSIYSDNICFYSVSIVPEGITLDQIPNSTSYNWKFSSSTLAAGIFGMFPTVIQIPGPIELNSKDKIVLRVRSPTGYAEVYAIFTSHITLN